MSSDKGKRAARWVAGYLQTQGWPLAEATPGGRNGADIENTPGIAWEVKTGVTWRQSWMRQAAGYDGKIKAVVWLMPGIGAVQVANAPAVLPLPMMAGLIEEAGASIRLPATTNIGWRAAWQRAPGKAGPLAYYPPAPAPAQAVVPLHTLTQLLREAGYV